MLEELVAQPHCLHVHVDIWQLNMFKLYVMKSFEMKFELEYECSVFTFVQYTFRGPVFLMLSKGSNFYSATSSRFRTASKIK